VDANTIQATAKLQYMNMTQLVAAITAVGALGTAAFGVVDAIKVLPGLLPSSGFRFIRRLVELLAPSAHGTVPRGSALTQSAITESLHANWINGVAIADQKSAAKTFFKLRMNPETAADLAAITGVDGDALKTVAEKLATGAVMTPEDMNVYGRFDVLLSTTIDRAYQKADQQYRTTAKIVAGGVAVLLTLIASAALGLIGPNLGRTVNEHNILLAIVVGLLATPLAPIAKDLTTALTSASGAVQAVKK